MVGEIRDRETADIAIRAALTGHFVFSTLHTNDAPSAITRLTDMGVENYLITSSLVAVLAQRLVRVICTNCKAPAGTAHHARRRARSRRFAARGCEHCYGTRLHGRVGIFELMELNDEIRTLIMRNADASKLTAGGAPQRHAQSARRRLAEGAPRRDHRGRSDARDAGILMDTLTQCTDAVSVLMATTFISRGRLRRQSAHRRRHRRDRQVRRRANCAARA